MKALFSRPWLLAAVEAAGVATSARSPMPVLKCVLIDASADDDGQSVALVATDMELWLRLAVPDSTVDRPGTVAVPRDRLVEVLRSCADDRVKFDADGAGVTISGLRSRTRLLCQNPSEFPACPGVDFGSCYSIAAGDLGRAIHTTLFAAAGGESITVNGASYQFGGCAFEFNAGGESLFVGGTEGHHAAGCDIKATPVGNPAHPGRPMIPARALRWLETRLGGVDDSDPVLMTFLRPRPDAGPNSVAVRFPDGGTMQSRLIEGRGTKIRDHLGGSGRHAIPIVSGVLLSAIQQAMVATAEDSLGVGLSISGGTLRLSSAAGDIGDAEAEIPVDFPGELPEIRFNPVYLASALRAVGSGTELQAEIGGPKDPIRLRMNGWSYAMVPLWRD